jgi:hypothetical protein
MTTMARIAWLVAAVLFTLTAWSHPATERYIPIGESPGVSGVHSHIGTIRSVVEVTEAGLTMRVGEDAKIVKVDRETKIYLQTADPRTSNAMGTYEDCETGRQIEAYPGDDGTAIWLKIRVP